jgi:hypothetical protein
MLPAVLENCAEITFPIQEELSVGLLFVGEYMWDEQLSFCRLI